MYLLAVKSFSRHLRPSRVYVLNDGTLTAHDLETLREHLPGHVLLELHDFVSPRCPRGGTWERLLATSSLVLDQYVIQLDADTLTLGPVGEVDDCVRASRAFTLGTWDDQTVETMVERREVALRHANRPDAHIQVIAEANLDKLAAFESMRYVRGCSGFAGFPKGSFSRAYVEDLSMQMDAALGPRWSEWGSEQFMSNILVANTADPLVLPHPKYCDCSDARREDAAFLHFIGSCRFKDGLYARLGRRVIASLDRSRMASGL